MRIILVVGLLVLTAVLSRLLPHPANVTPVSALALLFVSQWKDGAHRYAFALPLLAIFTSDLVLGFYPGIEFVYLGHLAASLMGVFLVRWNLPKLVGVSVAGSMIFFVLSNFGVWFSLPMYPKTFEGLLSCYVAALPFLRNSAIADVVFAVMFFSVVRYVASLSPKMVVPK